MAEQEQTTTVKFNQRQQVAGIWRDAGDTAEVYQREADAFVRRGVAEEQSSSSSSRKKSSSSEE